MIPLTHWQLQAAALPAQEEPEDSGFALPGADALAAFADLIGSEDDAPVQQTQSIPFALPGMISDDISGSVSLLREIDFGALYGDRAILTLDHICTSGEILIGDRVAARFGGPVYDDLLAADSLTAAPCRLAVDLTDALNLGRREMLTIRFDDARPVGLCGPACLHVTSHAYLCHASITPDPVRRTMALRVTIRAQQAGEYALRIQTILPQDPVGPMRESVYSLAQNEEKAICLSFDVPADDFVPGKPYAAPALKIQLFRRSSQADGLLCDDAILACGYGARSLQAFLPIKYSSEDPDNLCARMASLGVQAVSLPAPVPDCVLRALCRQGIAAVIHVPADNPLRASLLRHANVRFSDAPQPCAAISPEQSAWQMCSSVSYPRAIDETLLPAELLLDASGLPLEPDDAGVQDVLVWLRAVLVRLRAEAARQGRYQGALCACGDMSNPDVCEALRTAFAPVHLSALPLSGAWWTSTRFSATLFAFLPQNLCANESILAQAVLEDEAGAQLAHFSASCRKSGYAGVIEAQLPDRPCVLTLHTFMTQFGRVIEESTMPVYVGERGPLEAAFA